MTVREVLQILCRASERSQEQIAERAGLSLGGLRKRLCGATRISADELVAITRALGAGLDEVGDALDGFSPLVYLDLHERTDPRKPRYIFGEALREKAPLPWSSLRQVVNGLEELRITEPEIARERALRCVATLHAAGGEVDAETYCKAHVAVSASYNALGKTTVSARALKLSWQRARTSPALRVRTLQAIVSLARSLGDHDEALVAADQAVASAVASGSTYELGRALVTRGHALSCLDQHSYACKSYSNARVFFAEGCRWYEQVAAAEGVALSSMHLLNLAEAEQSLQEAIVAIRKTIDPFKASSLAGWLFWLRAEILLAHGKKLDAVADFERVLEFADSARPVEAALVSLELVEVYLMLDRDPASLFSVMSLQLDDLKRLNPLVASTLSDLLAAAFRGRATIEDVRSTYIAATRASENRTPPSVRG